jgi:hypothetical protein
VHIRSFCGLSEGVAVTVGSVDGVSVLHIVDASAKLGIEFYVALFLGWFQGGQASATPDV